MKTRARRRSRNLKESSLPCDSDADSRFHACLLSARPPLSGSTTGLVIRLGVGGSLSCPSLKMSSTPPLPSSLENLESLRVSVEALVGEGLVVEVTLSRPQKLNALGAAFWSEFPQCMRALDHWAPCRCILLSAEGPAFCSGIDLLYASQFLSEELFASQQNPPSSALSRPSRDVARKALRLREVVKHLQAAMSCVEAINKPVVAAVCGPCFGAGLDLICCCDIRLCAADSVFCVKEVDLGMAPDVGTLQRLPRIVRSGSWAREVCLSGRVFAAAEAEREGLVSAVHSDKETLRHAAVSLCLSLASKSPVALACIKQAMNYARGRPVDEGLSQQLAWSAAMLQTADIELSIQQQLDRRTRSQRDSFPPYANL
ncbi:hypothetical protein Efla_006360 [Eimeria flavescens]